MCLWGALCGAKCPFKDNSSSEKDEFGFFVLMASSDSTLHALRRGKRPEAEELIGGTNRHNLSN